MTRAAVFARLEGVFCDVFGGDVSLSDETAFSDVAGWDSFAHIALMNAVEGEFNVKFTMKDLARMEKVGELVSLVVEQSNKICRA